MRRAFWILLAIGLLLRLSEAFRPIDYSTYNAWRECDMGMIARNFWRGDMQILQPQVDWGGDGPGTVESEFPALPWLMALGYHAFGYHESIGRLIAVLVALASLWAFHRLARTLVAPPTARLATLLFWFNPILVRFGSNVQPDPGMVLAALLCAFHFLRWSRERRERDWLIAGAAGAAAILLKASAAFLGPFLVLACLRTWGWRGTLRQWRLWALAVILLVPPACWYAYAYGLWLTFGNSLGLSNESHWIGADLLRRPALLAHLLLVMARLEVRYVYMLPGVVLAAIGLWRLRRPTEPILHWLLAAALFQLLILRTTSQNWAYYYHVLSVPPACLLLALGAWRWPEPGASARVVAASLLRRPLAAAHALATAALVVTTLVRGTAMIDFVPPRDGEGPHLRAQFDAAKRFQPQIEPGRLVATCGDNALRDETGAPIAHNDSPFLFWLDRKGFTLTREEQVSATLASLHARGVGYVVCRTDQPVADYVQAHLRVLDRAGDYLLAGW